MRSIFFYNIIVWLTGYPIVLKETLWKLTRENFPPFLLSLRKEKLRLFAPVFLPARFLSFPPM